MKLNPWSCVANGEAKARSRAVRRHSAAGSNVVVCASAALAFASISRWLRLGCACVLHALHNDCDVKALWGAASAVLWEIPAC